jgi:two-component system osmolarity sensor histidine kinase EnvZ
VVGALSLLGAAFISSLINLPLARLTAAARASIAQGKRPAPLPEKGSQEIIEANRSFNQMVDDLQQLEKDRAMILAGISHDLRTPLARMQLEVEMANLSTEAREGMQSDIAQMDAIIGQFLDYAKPTEAATFVPVDLSELLEDCAHEPAACRTCAPRPPSSRASTCRATPPTCARDQQRDRERAPLRQDPGPDITEIDIACQVKGMTGHGRRAWSRSGPWRRRAGRPDPAAAAPFTRLDTARGQANGAGLGLAIVERVVTRHNAELQVRNREGGGLLLQCSAARYTTVMHHAVPPADVEALLRQHRDLLLRARLLFAGNSECARQRALTFRLSAIEPAAPANGAPVMFGLVFESDRDTIARVAVRKSRGEYAAWNVSCRAD